MCYAIPAKIIKIIDHKTAVIDYFGEHRNILLDLSDIKVGDYVYAQGGVSVRKVPEDEALSILETWKEVFFELKKTDEILSQLPTENVPENVLGVLQKVNLRKSLSRQDLLTLWTLTNSNELSVLYEIANHVRQRNHGNASCVHGIIEFSNYCAQNCAYCGIRRDQSIKRYRMTTEEIIAAARYAVDTYGFKALVLQSGEDFSYDEAQLIEIVKAVRAMGVLVFVSIGSRPLGTYQKLYDAGARAALIRFETSNEKIFAQLRPGTTLKERLDLIRGVREMGYVLATGFLLGLPNETPEDVINNILLTQSLKPDMYSFGPLIPTQGTPLEKHPLLDKNIVLKTIALTRLFDSQSNVLVTTALETLAPEAKREALLAGANSLMINVTPEQYRALYAIYDDRAGLSERVSESVQGAVDLLYSLGRAPTDLSIQGDIKHD